MQEWAEQAEQAATGDADAFAALLEPLLLPAYRLAVGMLQDRQEAEDAVQEASLLAWRRLPQLKPDGSVRNWFLAIVANRCRTTRRQRWWSVLRFGAIENAPPNSDEPDLVQLRTACRRLGDAERAVIALHYYLDLPIDEVAAVLGITREAARSRLYRAIRRLRPWLEEEEL
jgi:RNA polymerase sigma-70 factor (ECF subfamily)